MSDPSTKSKMVANAEKEVKEIEKQYNSGLLTSGERYNKVVDIWSHTNDQVSQAGETTWYRIYKNLFW